MALDHRKLSPTDGKMVQHHPEKCSLPLWVTPCNFFVCTLQPPTKQAPELQNESEVVGE